MISTHLRSYAFEFNGSLIDWDLQLVPSNSGAPVMVRCDHPIFRMYSRNSNTVFLDRLDFLTDQFTQWHKDLPFFQALVASYPGQTAAYSESHDSGKA